MSKNYYLKKREKYIKQITDIANSDIRDKNKVLQKIYNEYCMFCYRNNLSVFWEGYYELFNKSYIIESEPLIFTVDENKVKNICEKLLHINYKNQNGLFDGLSVQEVELILDWVVQNARNNLINDGVDIKNENLQGYCGLTQAYTLIPLMDLGLDVTINNACFFSENSYGFAHGFGTVKFPVCENGRISVKQYLVDASYRQFFSSILCSEGEYIAYDKKRGIGNGPSAGYYITKTIEGKKFCIELLKRGFVELTPENAKLYGHSFECQLLTFDTRENEKLWVQKDAQWYIDCINNNQVELDYSIEELENYKYNIDLPGFGLKR